MDNKNILYHGSQVQGLKRLIPHKRHTPQGKIEYKAVYATKIPGYAAAHSFAWSTNKDGVYLDVKDDGEVILRIPKQIKDRLMKPVSIYEVPPDNFTFCNEDTVGQTYVSYSETNVLKEHRFPNVIEALRRYNVDFDFTDGPVPYDAEF